MGHPYFIGFPVNAEPLAPLFGALPPGVVPTSGPDLHITVAYLGAVSEDLAHAAFRHAVANAPTPLDVTFDSLTLLGPREKPWAICLAPSRDAVLTPALSALRDPCRAAAGVPPEDREALPHVTVGAIPKDAQESFRLQVATWVRDHRPSPLRIELDELALFTHAPTGTRYRMVARHRM